MKMPLKTFYQQEKSVLWKIYSCFPLRRLSRQRQQYLFKEYPYLFPYRKKMSFVKKIYQSFLFYIFNWDTWTSSLRGGIKKNNCFFFGKTPKGGRGGLAESEISLSEKTEIFFEFFFKKGWEASPIPKGCYHKNQEFLDIYAKKGGLTQSIGILS